MQVGAGAASALDTIYVRADALGDDSDGRLDTPERAFRTIAAAVKVIARKASEVPAPASILPSTST